MPNVSDQWWVVAIDALYVNGTMVDFCNPSNGGRDCSALIDSGGGNLQLGNVPGIGPYSVCIF